MIHTNYKPQKGEQVSVADDLAYFDRNRIFSHIKNIDGIDYFCCFNDSTSLHESLKASVTTWKYCKRLNGLFHDDFKSVNRPTNKRKNKLFDFKLY